MKDFAGKVCFITGGASGVGFGQAQVFSEAGMKVVIADVRDDHIEKTAAYFKDKDVQVHIIKLDVTDREGWVAAADETERVYGSTPDLLLMTAGVNVFGPVEASTYEDFEWVIGVNLFGPINGFLTFVPRMIKAGKGGHIVVTSSGAAFGAGPTQAQYCCSKAAVLTLTESYYQALKPYGIAVSALLPANINSNIHDSVLKSRPERLKNTGFNVTEESTQFLYTAMHSKGTDPHLFAERLKKGIEDELFLIMPYPHAKRIIELSQERMPLYTSVEGMKELEERRKLPPTEEQKMLFFERENFTMEEQVDRKEFEAAGFGMVKKEIDWVLEEKKMK